MIVWLNGAFGVGKTTIAHRLCELRGDLRLFDPEWLGYMLSSNLHGLDIADFQDLAPWRTLVPQVARGMTDIAGRDLVAVQSVLVEDYWHELHRGILDQRLDVFHVVLDADETTLRERIARDDIERDAAQWRLDHLDGFVRSRKWLTTEADLVVDTSRARPTDVARTILATLDNRVPAISDR
jgi:adenylylsulfate kinase-like enzyme